MKLPAPLALIELNVRKKCVGCENEDSDQSNEEVYFSDDDENINSDDF